MSGRGLVPVWLPFISGVEVWVLRNGCLRTVSGWEQSSTKQNFPCAVRVPGGVNCKGNAYGFVFEAGRTVFDLYSEWFLKMEGVGLFHENDKVRHFFWYDTRGYHAGRLCLQEKGADMRLFHVSEESGIRVFEPRIPLKEYSLLQCPCISGGSVRGKKYRQIPQKKIMEIEQKSGIL